MADPRKQYEAELRSYGLGQGGLQSKIGLQRSPFAEEGPGIGLSSVPVGNGFKPLDSNNALGLPSWITDSLNEAAMPEQMFEENSPIDVADFNEFAGAYGDVMSALNSGPSPSGSNSLSEAEIQRKMLEDSLLAQAEGPESVLGLDEIDEKIASFAKKEAAEEFRANEANLANAQGGLNSSSVTQEQADEGFLAAMDDFFEAARGAGPAVPEKRTIEEYKKAFSEATGIDTSGKVDKKDALMAFGLALMQNKAGKGFNVGKMLQSVGEAGDKAMPALQRAKTLAREGALAGGKYALQTQAADEATRAAGAEKAMNRSSYYVYENDPEGKPYGRFDNGKTVLLNKYELNKLLNDPEFDSKYSFISGAQYNEVLKEKNSIPEYGEQWDKNERISLIGDDDGPEIFKVTGARRSSNYKGPRTGNSLQLAESPDEVYRRLMKEQDNVNLLSDQFSTAISQIQEGVSIPSQIGSAVTMGLRNLGVNVGDGTTSIKQVKNFLLRVQATNAANILGESGKTLSDNDRKMVANIVGDVNFNTATEEELLQKLGYIYQTVVERSQANIDTALDTLENEAGVVLPRSNEISQEQLKYLNERRVASGKKPYTMEEIQNFEY